MRDQHEKQRAERKPAAPSERRPSPPSPDISPWKVPHPKDGVTTNNVPEAVILPPDKMRVGMRQVIWTVVRFIMRVFFGMRAEGAEHIPKDEPVILIAEHRSILDIPQIHLSNRSWIHWLAKLEVFQNRFGFHFLPWWGSICVDRKNVGVRTARDAMKILKADKVLGVFPQGTRCRTEEDVRTTEPKPGVVHFALRTGAKLLPVAIDGEYKIFRKTRTLYGKPLELRLPEGKKRLSEADERKVGLEMMEHIYALKGERYPFRYPEGTPVSSTTFLYPADGEEAPGEGPCERAETRV